MKKVILIFGLLLFCTTYTSIAYAGFLNEYEATVVEVAKGQFEYEGIQYQLDSIYLNNLIDYLSSDEVELTEEQKNTVLLEVNDYIETGVQEGYLVMVQEQDKPEDTDTLADGSNEGANGDSTSEEMDKDDSETIENSNQENSDDKNQADQVDDLIKEILTKAPETKMNVDIESGKVTILDANKNNIVTVNTVVKNTGFNLNRTAMIVVGMGILMILCIYVTVKNNYFAQSDE